MIDATPRIYRIPSSTWGAKRIDCIVRDLNEEVKSQFKETDCIEKPWDLYSAVPTVVLRRRHPPTVWEMLSR